MLPKVASQIFHHTSRAVTATGTTLRNVLHTSAPPSTLGGRSGSGSNNSGRSGAAEPGGPKTHTGSRFHSSFVNSARVVAHVDPSASNVDSVDLSDDYLDSNTPIASRLGARTTHRLRSTTLSQGSQRSHEIDVSGVLKAVRQHVRTNHAFASVSSSAQSSEPPVPLLNPSDEQSAPSHVDDFDVELHSVKEKEVQNPLSHLISKLRDAKVAGNVQAVHDTIKALRNTGKLDRVGYNHILTALRDVRQPGQSLALLLEVYNEMLAREILPSMWTYTTLIMAFTDRDGDVCHTVKKLERRILQRQAIGLAESPDNEADRQKLAELMEENNLGSALRLFQTVTSRIGWKDPIPWTVYNPILRSCALHGNVDAALQIFAHFERRKDCQLAASPFAHLINTYARAGDINGAEQVFEEFKKASAEGKLSWSIHDRASQVAQVGVWNCMIQAYFACGQGDKGLGLLEQMLDSPAGPSYTSTDTPIPSPTTYSCIVTGFCRTGDMDSALTWFWRLLKDGTHQDDHLGPCTSLPKPTRHAVRVVVMHLLLNGNRIEDINKIWEAANAEDNSTIAYDVYGTVLMANVQYLETAPNLENDVALKLLDFVYRDILTRRFFQDWITEEYGPVSVLVRKLVTLHHRFGGLDAALDFTANVAYAAVNKGDTQPEQLVEIGTALIETARSLSPAPWTFKQELALAYVASHCNLPVDNRSLIDAFLADKQANEVLPYFSPAHSIIVLGAALEDARNADGSYSYSEAIETVMGYITDKAFQLSLAPRHIREALNEYIQSVNISRNASPTLTEAPSVQSTSTLSGTAVESPTATPVTIDPVHSNYVDQYRRSYNNLTVLDGYERLLVGAQLGVYPTPQILGRLINFLGRAGEVEKVKQTYHLAQTVVGSLETRKARSAAWFHIEDSMIIGLAHAGHVEEAHIHRGRILEQNGSPSADAYGALVQHVTSTTDDAANAMALYQEAVSRQVIPNLYLYNTIISKLAKARKADLALQLFSELKVQGITPSSVTYGSVIAACCRVGDAESAENLFDEMASQPSFKPRVPPYNTMMQFYTHTKPDRERVLFYYNALLHADVQPTAHTYKLLLDAYGTIAPLDFESMQSTFDRLVADKRVPVLGTHWAALINAYGVAGKDLSKALTVFTSIEHHPRSVGSALPDAVCFEAWLNVIVSLQRWELFEHFKQQLQDRGVHMTAYIANLLIKGYAAAGRMDAARSVFEGLVDPPEGVAAPNNHASSEQNGASPVSPYEPVYREPSTWETMIQAELSHAEYDKANELLARAEQRRFPEAVMARISGIRWGDVSSS